MKEFTLSPLPYDYDALEPVISRETLQFHHDKHQRSYVDRLNQLLPGSLLEDASLGKIVKESVGPTFEQAAQIWNHEFYWQSMTPKEAALEKGALKSALSDAFGSLDEFKQEFEKVGAGFFGSGWLWLVADHRGKVSLLVTHDAGNPIRDGLSPLLTCDLWEHAYYIDYRNVRARYLSAFFGIVNWEFASANFAASQKANLLQAGPSLRTAHGAPRGALLPEYLRKV